MFLALDVGGDLSLLGILLMSGMSGHLRPAENARICIHYLSEGENVYSEFGGRHDLGMGQT